MISFSKLKPYIVPIILWVLILLGLGFWFFSSFDTLNFEGDEHVSDIIMQENFVQIQPQLNRLVAMSNEDENVTRIAPSFTWLVDNVAWPRPESQLGFSQERWNEYKTLFNAIGSNTGIHRYPDGSVYIIMTVQGMVNRGSSKGYVYTTQTPSPLLDSTDSHSGYKRIADNWYIFFARD